MLLHNPRTHRREQAALAKGTVDDHEPKQPEHGSAERDVIALGIAAAAIILLVGTGGRCCRRSCARGWATAPPDMLLVNALLLNIALIIFGWRRYRELHPRDRRAPPRRRKGPPAGRHRSADPVPQPAQRHAGSDRGCCARAATAMPSPIA
jgi:hypothetical protein